MEGEVLGKTPTIEQVNSHLLEKLDELILSIDAKSDPEMVKVVTESVSKLNASLKGNDIFEKESEAERVERETAKTIQAIMEG